MIEQSLCHHLQSQLTEYYRLIAILESQMGLAQRVEDSSGHAEVDIREEETGLTLKRLDVWINEWRLRMRMMSVCVEGAKGNILCLIFFSKPTYTSADTHGGALVNLIHGYTDNGDPFIRKFTDQLLEEVGSWKLNCRENILTNSAGLKAFFRHSAQVDLFGRALRPLWRILCGDGSRNGEHAICAPFEFAWSNVDGWWIWKHRGRHG